MPVLPLKRLVYHIPEGDKPQDFETQRTWGGAGFLMGACIKYWAYLGAGEEREKNANPVACAFKKIYIKINPPGTTRF